MADGRVSCKYLPYLTKVRYLGRRLIPQSGMGECHAKKESTFSKKYKKKQEHILFE